MRVTIARDDGAFRFVDLPPGRYDAFVYPGGSQVDDIQLDGRGEAPDRACRMGWGPRRRRQRCAESRRYRRLTPGHKGLRVQAHGADWSSPICAPARLPNMASSPPASRRWNADYYIVTVDGAQDEHGRPSQLEARVQVDKRFSARRVCLLSRLLACRALDSARRLWSQQNGAQEFVASIGPRTRNGGPQP